MTQYLLLTIRFGNTQFYNVTHTENEEYRTVAKDGPGLIVLTTAIN